MNDLQKYFDKNTGRLITKWNHYFDIYDKHFSKFRGSDVHIVEFGVSHGGSLQMWKEYFGANAKIYGIDINPNCKQLEEDRVKIFIGDQEDRDFLKYLTKTIPRIDILIDDGGHSMKQQINTFEEIFPFVDKNGIYLCEDLHTSYRPDFVGGYKKRGTFIEYSKNFIDSINAWHSMQKNRLDVSSFTKSVHSLHYYDSILVIEKRPIEKPFDRQSGSEKIPDLERPILTKIKGRIKREFDRLIG